MSDTANMIKAWMGTPKFKRRIDEALMGILPGDAFAEQCIMVARDKELSRCSPDSLLRAFLQCAQLGLMPGPQKMVHLIARDQAVDVMISARGYKTLMERLPSVKRIKAELVHVRDTFARHDERHDDGRPQHEYDRFDRSRTFKGIDDLAGVYLEVRFADGDRDWFFLGAETVREVRSCSKGWERPTHPWSRWFGAMALKTVYRQAWNRMFLPAAPDTLNLAIASADKADRLAMDEHYSNAQIHPPNHAPAPAARALTYDDPAVNEPPQLTVDPEVIVTDKA